jgi:hypothetical protein
MYIILQIRINGRSFAAVKGFLFDDLIMKHFGNGYDFLIHQRAG